MIRTVLPSLGLAFMLATPGLGQSAPQATASPWSPTSTAAARARIVEVLTRLHERELEVAEQVRALEGPPTPSDDGSDADAANPGLPPELVQEEVEALRDELRSERSYAFVVVGGDPAALIDLVVLGGEVTGPLRGLLFEALASLDPAIQRRLLLHVCEELRGEAPLDALLRLGEVADDDVERRLLAMTGEADRFLRKGCFAALELGGREVTVRALLPVLLRGAGSEANEAFNVLCAIASREGDLVARLLAQELERDRARRLHDPVVISSEKRRVLAHQVLVRAASSEATRLLLAWVEDRLRELPAPDGTLPDHLLRAMEAGLEALAAAGDPAGVALVAQVEVQPGDPALREAAVRALARVPADRVAERELALLTLIEGLELAESLQEPLATRLLYVEALRGLTGATVSPSAAAWRDHVLRRLDEEQRERDRAEDEPGE